MLLPLLLLAAQLGTTAFTGSTAVNDAPIVVYTTTDSYSAPPDAGNCTIKGQVLSYETQQGALLLFCAIADAPWQEIRPATYTTSPGGILATSPGWTTTPVPYIGDSNNWTITPVPYITPLPYTGGAFTPPTTTLIPGGGETLQLSPNQLDAAPELLHRQLQQ
jgi:hypothetical protein